MFLEKWVSNGFQELGVVHEALHSIPLELGSDALRLRLPRRLVQFCTWLAHEEEALARRPMGRLSTYTRHRYRSVFGCFWTETSYCGVERVSNRG